MRRDCVHEVQRDLIGWWVGTNECLSGGTDGCGLNMMIAMQRIGLELVPFSRLVQ